MKNYLPLTDLRLAIAGICLIALMGVLLMALPIEGRSLYDPDTGGQLLPRDPNCDPYVTIRTHNRGVIGLSITNQGQIGLGYTSIEEDPTQPGIPAPSLTYPYPGSGSYLNGAAYWIGAIVDGDTLVSMGADGWFQVEEFYPDSYPGGDIIFRTIEDPLSVGAVSHQDYIAKFTDTLGGLKLEIDDPSDPKIHYPLNIEITQSSFNWAYDEAEDFVIFDCKLKNIGDDLLENACVGLMYDGDVGWEEIYYAMDDIAGLRCITTSVSKCGYGDTIFAGYIMDNNGKMIDWESCPFTSEDFLNVAGFRILEAPNGMNQVNFNWWISDGDTAGDFGPRRAGIPEDPFYDFGGQLGTPEGDRSKYYIMSHPEIDYDQMYTRVDHSLEGWLPPPSRASDIANGRDTRFLFSFVSGDIPPGGTVSFAFAIAGGMNLHHDCNAYYDLFDPLHPDIFYNQLDFGDFDRNMVYAGWYYDNPGYDTDGDGYLGKFRICCIDSSFINGEWSCTVADTEYYEGDGVPDLRPFKPHVSPFIDPAQLHWADGNLVHPESVLIYIDDDYYYLHPDDVNPATVRVNGLVPNDVYVGTHPVLGKPALVAEVDKSDFVESYGIIWGGDPHPYQVTGNHNSGMPFDIEGQVMIVGHIPGDVNADKRVDVLDVIYLVDYKFHHGTPPRPFPEIGDVDASGGVNILDMIYLVNYLFKGGPAPRHP